MKRQSGGSPVFSFAGLNLTSGCYPSIRTWSDRPGRRRQDDHHRHRYCRETSSANLQLIQGVLTRLSDRKVLASHPVRIKGVSKVYRNFPFC
jgi:hypothetical protein